MFHQILDLKFESTITILLGLLMVVVKMFQGFVLQQLEWVNT
jgi:hypothetical protein